MIESPNLRADTTANFCRPPNSATNKREAGWLPMPFGLIGLPTLRRLSKQSLPGEPDDHGPE
jgi:hypothetical protein